MALPSPITSAGVGPSSGPARPRPIHHVDRQQGSQGPGCSPANAWVTCAIAGPGEAGWNPVDAHARRPSCRSPFDPIEGDASRRGNLRFPGGHAETPAVIGTPCGQIDGWQSKSRKVHTAPVLPALRCFHVRRKVYHRPLQSAPGERPGGVAASVLLGLVFSHILGFRPIDMLLAIDTGPLHSRSGLHRAAVRSVPLDARQPMAERVHLTKSGQEPGLGENELGLNGIGSHSSARAHSA